MKTSSSARIKKIKDTSPKTPVIHSSVSFQNRQPETQSKGRMAVPDFFQELKALIDSGDDSVWRLWR